MERPKKEDYNNDFGFKFVSYSRDIEKYIDHLESQQPQVSEEEAIKLVKRIIEGWSPFIKGDNKTKFLKFHAKEIIEKLNR